MRTQLAIFTGPAPSAPRYRAVVVSCSATRLPGGGGLFCVCPAHFHCPPKVSARINAHILASPSLPRRTVPFSFFLLVRLSSPLTRAFFIARCLVVACPLVNFAPATMPRGGRETRRQQPLPPPLSLSSSSSSPLTLTPPSSSHLSSSSYLPLPSDAAAASYRRCCHDLLCSR